VKHSVKEEFRGVAAFIGMLWIVYLLDWVLPGQWTQWGITPRTLWGIAGIPLAPFLHANLAHLLGNSIPLAILLMLLAGSRTRTWETVAEIALLGGGLLWLFGRPAVHVGASGLIYGLIAFLIVSGLRERRLVPLAVALFVGFLYGGTLMSGVLPTVGSNVSWDGHLCGAIAGGLIGYTVTAGDSQEPSDSL
jgi:membrane associated rhomboid family serine protease